MSPHGDRSQLARQLASQGWSEAAIAAATHTSAEQVRALITSADSSKTDAHRREAPSNRPLAAEEIGRATLERLAQHCMRQQAEAATLRAEIKRLADRDQGPKRGKAVRIQPQLTTPRSLRCVQWHLKAIAQRRI